MFLVHLQQFLDVMPTSCPILIIGNFNIDMFDQNSTQPNELQTYLDYYSMELQKKEIATIYHSHTDHVSTNAPIQQCMSRVVKAYWIIGLTINQYILHKKSQDMSHNIIT
jgi:proteasome lid subunit RPN8/RPN11